MTPSDIHERLAQFHHNQSLWLARLATGELYPHVPGHRMMESHGALTVLPGRSGVVMLPMDASLDRTLAGHAESLAWLRHAHARDVLVWSMVPNPDLDLALLAQGYRVGFEPWWMSLDLSRPIPAAHHDVRPATTTDIDRLMQTDVPYVIREQVPAMRALLRQPREAQVLWLIAHHHNQVVGHAIVNISGDHAGLFNVGVSARFRHQGIGLSLTLASMRMAWQVGAQTMNLNSTPMGKGLYERAGFVQVGTGQTWNRLGPNVYKDAPLREQQIVTAIGKGDIEHVAGSGLPTNFACGLSAQELAARFGQVDMLRQLIRMGEIPDIIALWRAGLRDEAIAAAHSPLALALVTGSQRAFPIHHAVEMGAGTLVLAMIEAGVDLKVRDGEFNATPLDWAHATNKPTIARILTRAGGK